MNAMVRRKRHNAGYTLLEMLMYVAVMTVLVSLCGKLFASGLRLSALSTQTLDRIMDVANLESDFTGAVRGAQGVVPEMGSYRSGPEQLVLRVPAKEGRSRYIVFGKLRDARHLSRMDVLEQNGVFTTSRFVTYRVPVDAITFDTSTPGLIQLDVLAKGRQEKSLARRFIAAPRGIGDQP